MFSSARSSAKTALPEAEWQEFDSFAQPDTLDPAACAYKARPLAGIWATPPYRHNGSVLTIYDLPGEERTESSNDGSLDDNPVKFGFLGKAGQTPWCWTPASLAMAMPATGPPMTSSGRTLLVTSCRTCKGCLLKYLKIASNADSHPGGRRIGPLPVPYNEDPAWA